LRALEYRRTPGRWRPHLREEKARTAAGSEAVICLQSNAVRTLPRATVVTAAAVGPDHRVVLGPQRACEAILGRELDKGAFRRKIADQPTLVPVPESFREGHSGRRGCIASPVISTSN
jgi:hypothetical protein